MRSQFTGQSRVAGWIGGVGLFAVGFIVGQLTHSPVSHAQQEQAAPSPPAKSESATRVVAYIHGSIPITREEYGEFLIARANYNQLEKLVNRRILEIECEKKGFVRHPRGSRGLPQRVRRLVAVEQPRGFSQADSAPEEPDDVRVERGRD
jgi:hypothetical protein